MGFARRAYRAVRVGRPRQELVTHSDGRAEDDVGEGAAAAEVIRTGIWAAPPRHQLAAERMPKSRNTAVPPPPDRPGALPRPGNAPRFLSAQVRSSDRLTSRPGAGAGITPGAIRVARPSRRGIQFRVRKSSMTSEPPYGIEP